MNGFVETTMDALIIFQACLDGILQHVARRPHDRERDGLIRSGFMFVYEETTSGIKRWTDGCNWSPSRINNNYLLYRELGKPFPPGEKKKAMKKKANGSNNRIEGNKDQPEISDLDRNLYGSLTDSYDFKPDGLMKKTISVHWNNVTHHLVSYYKPDDVKALRLHRPRESPLLRNVVPTAALISHQNFRQPVEHDEFWILAADGGWVQAPHLQALQGGHYQSQQFGQAIQQPVAPPFSPVISPAVYFAESASRGSQEISHYQPPQQGQLQPFSVTPYAPAPMSSSQGHYQHHVAVDQHTQPPPQGMPQDYGAPIPAYSYGPNHALDHYQLGQEREVSEEYVEQEQHYGSSLDGDHEQQGGYGEYHPALQSLHHEFVHQNPWGVTGNESQYDGIE
jgi:hypothetical protein